MSFANLIDSNLYASFNGTAASSAVVQIPSGNYKGFVMTVEYTVTSSGGTPATGAVNTLIDKAELMVEGNTQWNLRTNQTATFSLLNAMEAGVPGIVPTDADLTTIPTTCGIYNDPVWVSGTEIKAQYLVLCPINGASAQLDLTFDPNNLIGAQATTISACSINVTIGMITGGNGTNRAWNIYEETAEKRNDIVPPFNVGMVYIRTATASDITRVEAPGFEIDNIVLFENAFQAAAGCGFTAATKNYLFDKPFPANAGMFTIVANTSEARTIYLASVPRSSTANSATNVASANVRQLPSRDVRSAPVRVQNRGPRLRMGNIFNRRRLF